MKNLKIGRKLLIAFLAILITLASVTAYGLYAIHSISLADQDMYNKNLVGLSVMNEIIDTFYNLRLLINETTYQDASIEGANLVANNLASADAKMQADFAKYAQTATSQENKDKLATLESDFSHYKEQIPPLMDLLKSKADVVLLSDQLSQANGWGTKIMADLSQMTKYNQDQGVSSLRNNQSLEQTSTLLLIVIAAAAGAITLLLGYAVSGSIANPINRLVGATDQLADGNIEIDFNYQSKDEIGLLAKTFAHMVTSIRNLISDIDILSRDAMEGRFTSRADSGRHRGDYRRIVEGVNATLDAVVDKVFWYESLLDSIPFSVVVSNKAGIVAFANAAIINKMGIPKEYVIGSVYNGWNTEYEYLLELGVQEERARRIAQNEYQVDSFTLYNLQGEEAGQITLVQDITAKARAYQYNRKEVAKLAYNLQKLQQGNLQLSFNVEDGDEHTLQEKETFEEINHNFKDAVDAIKSYIHQLNAVLGSLADGDLTVCIEKEFKGDFAALKESISRIISGQNRIFIEIYQAAQQVAQATQQLVQGNEAISLGAAEQSTAIEEFSATIRSIADQTRKNTEYAKQTGETARTASGTAEQGNLQMQDMLRSMQEITESSDNIERIIKSIDDIAFQTNILALNAAVEAAHAGVYGKGFAVVAQEVRGLAGKSVLAAKETAELIEGSKQKVYAGTAVAQQTADVLAKIVKHVEQTVELGQKIASASQEQALGIEQVRDGIEQMSVVVQGNSASTQQGAAASQELFRQATLLKEKIGVFKLKEWDAQETGEEEEI